MANHNVAALWETECWIALQREEQIQGLLYYCVTEGTSEAKEESNSNCSSSQKLG